jgi:CBS domain containing-hemolysin-like protein
VPRTRMATLQLGARIEDVAGLLTERPHTRYPVIQDNPDHVLGCVHVKDLLRAFPQRIELGLELVREMPFLPATAPLDRVLADLRNARAQMAVVMDEHGGTAGIVTLEDLFEEVVGEVGDSRSGEPVQRDHTGVIRAAGTARLDELGAALGLSLEREDVDTVSGLVIGTLGRPARVGDVVDLDGLVLAVTAVHGRGVQEVRVVRAPEHPGTEGRDG